MPVGLSTFPIALKVEQRFGLAGYARLHKLVEAWAASRDCTLGVVELGLEEWQDRLQASPADIKQFLNYLAAAEWLAWSEPDNGSLRVTLRQCIDWLPESELGLYATAAQWVVWSQSELGLSNAEVSDPYVLRLFRHWCASNVTVADAMEALTGCIERGVRCTPTNLHDELISLRGRRIARAKEYAE